MTKKKTYDEPIVKECKEPLVTFCIMAFNQKSFVEIAAQAAFAQTYKNTQIIISDDCSSDGTWDVIKSIANSYRGPAPLLIRRGKKNRGVLHHLLDIAEEASGRLLIVSAADDVSLPERTEVMVKEWLLENYSAAFSDYMIIDDTGAVIEKYYRFDDSRFSPRDYISNSKAPNIHGASSVYDIEDLKKIGRPSTEDLVLFEDTWLSLAFAFTGHRIAHIPVATVQYRRHAGSITNSEKNIIINRSTMEHIDRQWQKHSALFSQTLVSFKSWHERQLMPIYPLGRRFDNDIKYFIKVSHWSNLKVWSRLATPFYASRWWMVNVIGLRLVPMWMRIKIKNARRAKT